MILVLSIPPYMEKYSGKLAYVCSSSVTIVQVSLGGCRGQIRLTDATSRQLYWHIWALFSQQLLGL